MNIPNRDKTFFIFFFSLLLSTASFAQCTKLFVSVSGSNENKGTIHSPFATLERAIHEIEKKRLLNPDELISIQLREGTYYVEKTVDILSVLSNLKIEAYQNEKVIFSGGNSISLENMKPAAEISNTSGKAWKIDLKKAGISNFGKLRNVGFSRPYAAVWGELFVNKKPMHLSRWPNKRMIPIGEVLEPGSIPRNGDYSNKGGIMKYDSLRINRWANEKDAWMAGYFMWGYADDMVKIASIDTTKQTITTASATLYGYGDSKPWRQWYGVNILAELDEEGEYYIERKEGILYFISDEKKIETLEFSVFEDPFVNLKAAKNVIISGITFECSRGLGIAMDNTENVTIKACTFRNLGSLAIIMGKGIEPFTDYRHEGTGNAKSGIVGSLQQHFYANSTFNREGGTDNKITGCQFYNLGAGGVILGGGNLLTLEAGNNTVENCVFHDLNRIEKSYRPAVYLTGVGNKIRHCEIFNTPSMAIYMMFGNNNIIEYNYLHEVCVEAEDQGAIYYGRNPAERGNIIRYNYFENIPDHYRTCAVYHDDGAGGMTVTGNIFYKAGYWNVLIGGGSNNSYSNNIFIDTKFGIHIDNRMQNWAKSQLDSGGIFEKRLNAVNYQNPPYSVQYPELPGYFDKNPALPKDNIIENNVFVQVKTLLDGKKEWLDFKDNNWVTDENPGFVDMVTKDFRIKENAELFRKIKGFESIPFEKIGK